MTATPLRDDNRDTYLYFGNPIYQYSLRQGIEDGFLAPYRVHRVVTEWDAAGWRPSKDELDRYGRAIPDEEYQTKDFEKVVALRARNCAIAKHLTEFLKRSDRYAKTIVFCVDQEHASDMREELSNLNSDLVVTFPDYVCRVTSDKGDIGRGHLGRFSDVETQVPAILTTSQLLTTGIDAPTCKNIVIARVVGSMSEFKQIIGRGTRVRDDYGKLWFNIIDYTGSATRLFADPAFDGEPVLVTEEEMATGLERVVAETAAEEEPAERRKYYFDGGQVEIAAYLVYELDPDGNQLRVVRYTDYAAERIRSICPSARDLRARWVDPDGRAAVVVPNGTLFGDGVCARIKAELIRDFNLHTIVRLPNGVFAPYTPISANLLFFDRSGPTKDVWYYEHPLPEGRKNYTKTQPLQFEEFSPCIAWWKKRKENEQAWKVSAQELLSSGCNLDRKNPHAKEDIAHKPPEELVTSILEKEKQIIEIVGRIQEMLKRKEE